MAYDMMRGEDDGKDWSINPIPDLKKKVRSAIPIALAVGAGVVGLALFPHLFGARQRASYWEERTTRIPNERMKSMMSRNREGFYGRRI